MIAQGDRTEDSRRQEDYTRIDADVHRYPTDPHSRRSYLRESAAKVLSFVSTATSDPAAAAYGSR